MTDDELQLEPAARCCSNSALVLAHAGDSERVSECRPVAMTMRAGSLDPATAPARAREINAYGQ